MPEKPTCPLSHEEAVDRYFLEHRAKVLDIAAFLDRLDRCDSIQDDYRIDALRASIEVLLEDTKGRSERILNILSDPSAEPVDNAGEKEAEGAPNPSNE